LCVDLDPKIVGHRTVDLRHKKPILSDMPRILIVRKSIGRDARLIDCQSSERISDRDDVLIRRQVKIEVAIRAGNKTGHVHAVTDARRRHDHIFRETLLERIGEATNFIEVNAVRLRELFARIPHSVHIDVEIIAPSIGIEVNPIVVGVSN
jgi:hypothetical protein